MRIATKQYNFLPTRMKFNFCFLLNHGSIFLGHWRFTDDWARFGGGGWNSLCLPATNQHRLKFLFLWDLIEKGVSLHIRRLRNDHRTLHSLVYRLTDFLGCKPAVVIFYQTLIRVVLNDVLSGALYHLMSIFILRRATLTSLLISLDHAAYHMIHDYGKRIRLLCTRS